ncbi:MAG TPA: DUF5655 domain-containing protein [Streptosporangiaceae bacterium]|jgi:hypothetical protein
MPRWTCPACDREFARARQSHFCVPGCTVEETFAGRPPVQREIYDAVVAYLTSLGPVHDDAVRVGVFLKSDRKIAELRPRVRWLSLFLALPRRLDDPRVSRVMDGAGDRVFHDIRLYTPDDVDDPLRAWLTEAYDYATD